MARGKTGLRAYGNKRDQAEADIVDVLRKAGCSVVLMDKPTDLLIGFRGQTFIAECKTGKGKLTADQKDFLASWRGSPVTILRTVDDALAALKAWGSSQARAA